MFDLNTLDSVAAADTGAPLTLRHPVTNAPLEDSQKQPVTILLAGDDAARVREARAAIANRRMSRPKGQPVTFEEIDDDALETLVAATIGWSGLGLGEGQPLPFTIDTARAIYKRFPWIREQAEAFVSERKNFLKPSRAS